MTRTRPEPGATRLRDAYRRRETCRGCGGTRLRSFLSLGPMALANAFLTDPEEFERESTFPLDVYFCEDCSLVQLLDVVDPEILFRDYIYVTGTSETIAAHNRAYACDIVERQSLEAGDLVVEVASNDGSLLRCFTPYDVRTLGIEPATNIAALARKAGIDTVNEFFDSRTARRISEAHGPARVVIANNVLAHVDDPVDFLTGCRTLTRPDGLVVIEVPYLRDLLDRLEYDTIYHEHLCYFSVTSLLQLFARAGLSVVDVHHVPVHGGSLRVSGRSAGGQAQHAADVLLMADGEAAAGLTRFARYADLAAAVEANRGALVALLRKLRDGGASVAAYGAPAKGNTLLNYCGITTDLIPYAVDRSPLKVGKYTPGTHIPVLSVETLSKRRSDYLLILAWNFAEEIMRQQAAYAASGGKFIVPIPEPRVVEP